MGGLRSLLIYVSGYKCDEETKILVNVSEPSPYAIIDGKLCKLIDSRVLELSEKDVVRVVLRFIDQDPLLKELLEQRKKQVMRYA